MENKQESKCKKCGVVLVEGKNWYPSCAKRNVRVCKQCHKEYYKKYILSRHSKSLGSIFCPKCGVFGSLKLRTTVYKSGRKLSYLQVDHYRIPNNHTSGYVGCCYLGKRT